MEEVHEDSNFLVACRAKCLGIYLLDEKAERDLDSMF